MNGIRACVKHGFVDFLQIEKPEILGLQEIKISHAAREKETFDFAGFAEYWNPAQRPGYSGTAILVRDDINTKVIKCTNGWGEEEFDNEGRVVTLELPDFFVVNCYFPNANGELSRLGYKTRFNQSFLSYIKKLEKKKPVITCGDFNVAHEPIDLTNPKPNEGSAGYTAEERRWMTKFIDNGFVDTFRYFFPKEVKYSWWSYRFGARRRNIGWRIDYFLVSKKIIKNIKKALILNEIEGSDHCPVGIIYEKKV